MADAYPRSTETIIAPGSRMVALTLSDSVDLADISVGIAVKTAGDYPLVLAGMTAPVTITLAAGIVHPLRVKRAFATGAASASGVVAIYGG